MKLKAFAVYDSKVQTFQSPNFMKNEGVMARAIYGAFKDQNTDLAKYPDEFIVYEIGEFDDQTGVMEQYATPMNIGTVLHIALGVLKEEKKAQRAIQQFEQEMTDEISDDA